MINNKLKNLENKFGAVMGTLLFVGFLSSAYGFEKVAKTLLVGSAVSALASYGCYASRNYSFGGIRQ